MIDVVAAVIWRQDRFLICQRPAHKARGLKWEFVGGKVERGETREEALARECREELAVEIDVLSPFMDFDYVYPDIAIHLWVYSARIVRGEPTLLEHADARWIYLSDTDGYAFCPADEAIAELLSHTQLKDMTCNNQTDM